MSGNSAFELVNEQGWRRGINNLLNSEFSGWWKTNLWWIQILIWGGITGFFLGVAWFSSPTDFTLETGVMLYCIFAGLFPAVAVIIIMQDAVVGEKQSGTAAWVLSKPVSRPAFILSKLIANSLGVLICIVIVPGILAYIIFWIGNKSPLNPIIYIAGLAIIFLVQLYFLTFTVMLGTLFSHRGPVIGIGLALLFFQQYLIGLVPALRFLLPWTLVVPLNNSKDAVVPALLLGQPINSFLPIILIILEILLFGTISLWRFSKEEF